MNDLSKRSPIKPNPPTFIATKSNLPNFIDNAVKMAKKSPGVGRYSIEQKDKILGNYTIN